MNLHSPHADQTELKRRLQIETQTYKSATSGNLDAFRIAKRTPELQQSTNHCFQGPLKNSTDKFGTQVCLGQNFEIDRSQIWIWCNKRVIEYFPYPTDYRYECVSKKSKLGQVNTSHEQGAASLK
jgi:hypothetical protein